MRGWVLLLALLAGLVMSGMQIAKTGYQVRMLNWSLEELRLAHDTALVEQTQLQLERGAVASLAKTESVARRQLAMVYPERMVVVAP